MFEEDDDTNIHFTESDANPDENPDNAYQESVYISFVDFDKAMGGVWRIGLEHNQKRANCCATLWRETGPSYRYFSRQHTLPAADWRDMSAGVLNISVTEPWKKVHATLTDSDISVEMSWTAATPTFDFAKEVPEQLVGAFREHYQQVGRFSGRMKWDGESFDLSGICFRDHSWGVRRWGRGWKWTITGGAFLREETILYVMMGHRQGRMNAEGLVLTHMDPEQDTRVNSHISNFCPVLSPPPIVSSLSYPLHTPPKTYRLWGAWLAPRSSCRSGRRTSPRPSTSGTSTGRLRTESWTTSSAITSRTTPCRSRQDRGRATVRHGAACSSSARRRLILTRATATVKPVPATAPYR